MYEFDDGRVEFGESVIERETSVQNLRAAGVMSEVDPNAPADHPDAQSELTSITMCYDVTNILHQVHDDNLSASEADFLAPPTKLFLIIDDKLADKVPKMFSPNRTSINPGDPIPNEPYELLDDSEQSSTKTVCANPSADDFDLENITGVMIQANIIGNNTINGVEADPEQVIWRIDIDR